MRVWSASDPGHATGPVQVCDWGNQIEITSGARWIFGVSTIDGRRAKMRLATECHNVSTSIIYRFPWLYKSVMFLLYRGGYRERSKALATLIPDGASVVDLCCGPAALYFDHLRFKRVAYTGLDINSGFIESVASRGAKAMVWDVSANAPLPKADYLIMQSSLYHFLPDPRPVVDRMLEAAEKNVFLTEPVRNIADSSNPAVAWLARKLTNPGTGDQPRRFNAERFEQFLKQYREASLVVDSYPTAGGREQLCILRPDHHHP